MIRRCAKRTIAAAMTPAQVLETGRRRRFRGLSDVSDEGLGRPELLAPDWL